MVQPSARKKVVVTGGSGRLGRYVTAELRDSYDVTAVDKVAPGGGLRFVEADILDLPAISAAIEGHDAVIHLAAIDSAIAASQQEFYATNTLGTWNVLAACQKAAVRRAVVCSSIAAYGLETFQPWTRLDYLPFDEKHPLRPVAAYELSKKVTETIAEAFATSGQLDVICLRPSWIIFPDRVLEFDDRARNEDIQGEVPAKLLPPYRSYVRPDDVARAFRLSLECDIKGFDVFNIGASDTFSPAPTIEFARRLFGPDLKLHDPSLFADNPRAAAFSNAKARAVLAWEPTADWSSYVAEVQNGSRGR